MGTGEQRQPHQNQRIGARAGRVSKRTRRLLWERFADASLAACAVALRLGALSTGTPTTGACGPQDAVQEPWHLPVSERSEETAIEAVARLVHASASLRDAATLLQALEPPPPPPHDDAGAAGASAD